MIRVALTNGSAIDRVHTASSWWRRLCGLFHPDVKGGNGLLIYPCNSIHTFFMREVIDVVFLDNSKKILSVHSRVSPNRIAIKLGAHYVLELGVGLVEKYTLKVGDQLEF